MEAILKRINENRRATNTLRILSIAISAICAVAFSFMIISSFYENKLCALKLLISAALPFIIVSASRFFIDAKRPYEVYDFYEIAPKKKRGKSFPSRHVFSAFMISTLLFTVSPWFAILFYLISSALAVCRVLLGMHFIRDVIAGTVIGILSGVIALMVL